MEILNSNECQTLSGSPETTHAHACATRHDAPATSSERADRAMDLRQLDIDLLQPGRFQPRRQFTPGALADLTASIRTEGVLQPILVRPLPGTTPACYEIIAGERRWRAAQRAGLQQIPALVHAAADCAALVQALVENIQREDLNPVEAARGVARLIDDFQLTHTEVARRLGRSREAITHLLRILKLEPRVLARVEDRQLSLGHAKLLAGLPQAAQCSLAEEAVRLGLPVRALAQRIRSLNSNANPSRSNNARRDVDIVRLERRVGELVGAETGIDYQAESRRGRITFAFHSLEALAGILERLGYHE